MIPGPYFSQSHRQPKRDLVIAFIEAPSLTLTGRPAGKWLDGELIAYFVFDSAEAQQQNLDGQPVVDGKVVTAVFPWDAVSDLGAVWNWSATTTVEGEDADYCPEPGAEVLNPKKARFPSS
jgi:hypothetical protein